MYIKNYNTKNAHTLSPEYMRVNESGWKISGTAWKEYAGWINDFSANHPEYGKVWGNFEKTVYADSIDGFNHFIKNHPPDSWDYFDMY